MAGVDVFLRGRLSKPNLVFVAVRLAFAAVLVVVCVENVLKPEGSSSVFAAGI